MSLEYILRRTASSAGINLDDAESRSLLVDIVNEAAEEVWDSTDIAGSLRELFITVDTDRILALPENFGELKAVRDANIMEPWGMQDMRPRYHTNPWPSIWNKFRHLGYSALKTDITNVAPLSYHVSTPDETLVVTSVGSTVSAARDRETITMSASDVTGTKNFTEIESITSNKLASCNVEVYDADGNLLSVLYNNVLDARYSLYDITGYPSTQVVMEVLYKIRLPRLENDSDSFPVPDFDNIVVMKVKQLFAEETEGKGDYALAMHKKIDMRISKKVIQKGGTNEKQIGFAPNPFHGMFRGQYGRRRNSDR